MTNSISEAELLEEVVKHPDELFPTFSEEMAERARNELRKLFEQSKKNKTSE